MFALDLVSKRPVVVLIFALLLLGAPAVSRAAAVQPRLGGWKGRTTQGLPVYFGVREGRVVNVRYRFRWGWCGVFEDHDRWASLEIDPAAHWVDPDPRGSAIEGTFVSRHRLEGLVSAEGRELPSCPHIEAKLVAWPRRR